MVTRDTIVSLATRLFSAGLTIFVMWLSSVMSSPRSQQISQNVGFVYVLTIQVLLGSGWVQSILFPAGEATEPIKMSLGVSGKNIMDKTLDILKTEDVDTLCAESERLLIENSKLRKLMGLMQENVELRGTLRNHEMKIRSLSPPRTSKNNPKDKDKNLLETRPITKGEAPTTASRLPPDPEKVKQCERIVGEIAFQLDRRILCTVFLEQQRLYGYRVANIKEKIMQVSTCPLTGKVDEQIRSDLKQRYHHTMDQLKKLGYDPKVHPYVTEHLVNTYGIMKERTTAGTEEMSSTNDPQSLSKMITECMQSDKVEDIQILLQCLAYLAKQNGKPMFIW